MNSRHCMINLMADIIGLDEKYVGEKLNNPVIWEEFIDDVFHRMETIEDKEIRDILSSTDKEVFQCWIDDPKFWLDVDAEIVRRGQFIKTISPSKNHGYC